MPTTSKADFSDASRDTQEPLHFWEEKQRELVTSVVDYNLSTLHSLVNDQSIDLSPDYQRRNRWDNLRKSKLIESFLINVPVPPIFLNEDNYGEYSIIDGKQRLTAIHDFLSGNLRLQGLSIYGEINDKRFHELPSKLQTVIRTRPTLRAVIILRQSDADIKYEVFRRLNTGGVELNAQETRNSVQAGTFSRALVELSEIKTFQKLLGIKTPSLSKVYQEMTDVELVLRYFTFRNTWKEFSGGIVRHLDAYMDNNRDMSPERIEEAKMDFRNTLAIVNSIWGENAFQRWSSVTGKWRNQRLAALFDAQMIACKGGDYEKAVANRYEIQDQTKALFDNDDFQKAISASVPRYFKLRIEMVEGIVAPLIK